MAEAATVQSVAPFDLSVAPLARATLYRLSDTRHVLVLTAHHIVTDGWSMALLSRDFAAAYGAAAESGPLRGLVLPERDAVDFSAAALAAREGLDEAPLRAFWRGKLGDLPELLELPTDRPRPDVPDGRGRVHRFALDGETAAALRDTARRIGVTPFALLQAAFGLTLARYAGQAAFAIGTVHAGRGLPGAEEVVGFFADTLALRFDVSDRPTFAVLAARAQQEFLDAIEHAGLPFEAIVEDLVTERSEAHAPIVQALFVWQNTPPPLTAVGGLTLSAERLDKGATQFDLVLDMTEGPGAIEAMLEYRTQLFEPETIARFADAFRRLLAAALATPDASVADLAPEAPAARNAAAAMPDIADRRVDAVLDEHARARPDAIAVTFEAADGSVTELAWGDFEARAAALAAHLQAEGVAHGDAVALCAERSPALLVAIYAILKAGAAYVPLDPAAPAERQRALLAASGARILLTEPALLALFTDEEGVAPLPVHLIDRDPPRPLPPRGRPPIPACRST